MNSNKPIQLTYLINTLSIGGAERGMARLLSGLPNEKFEITIIGLTSRDGGIVPQLPDYAEVIDLRITSPVNIFRIKNLWSQLSETDVLVTSLYHSSQIGRILGTLKRVPVILSWQHSERLESRFRQRTFGLLSSLDSQVLADSQAAVSGARKSGVNPQKISQIPIAGIDLDLYSPVTHYPQETITVGTLGRLTREKNIQAVLDVANSLQSVPIEFRIGGDGPQRSELEEYTSKNGLQNVTFEGLINDVPGFMSSLDIYFQPSRREGLCITVLEAMAAELPIVASDVGGISETVVPGETGVLASPDDIELFTEQILELSDDPDRRAAYGSAGQELVSECYSQEQLVKKFLDVVYATYSR